MIPFLSLVTSVKDYLEVVHKLIEYDSVNMNYTEFGTLLTFFLISLKTFFTDFLSLVWLKNLWSLPIIIPDISAAMVSEISVLDGYFHNAFNFLETPISYGDKNTLIYCFEKFTIGFINSFFLFLPTSTSHIITLRRFVMQGLSAGYISGLGTIAGNVLWLTSVILGWRFFVIPWLSLDFLRYVLGFILLVKYMWDSYNEQKMVLENLSKKNIFLLNFLLALIEQTSIYPFISNLSISPEASLLESFPVETYSQFVFVHIAYLFGITLGCLSLLHLTCWFWENPAFKLYMWIISSNKLKVSTSFYYKVLNFTFLYLTMLSAISSIPYYGLDYTITKPLGYVNEDRIIQDKTILETSFLGGKASDRNTRRNRGRHGRRERWKRRIRKYRTFDTSLYDQGIYDLFTIEDLNYGFDRFWLRRKLRNHRVRFRFFPGPWMRNFKKQLAKPRLESYTGPRIEFFRILFEQVYHPSFHAYDFNKNKQFEGKMRQGERFSEKEKNLKQIKELTLTEQQLVYPNMFNTQKEFSIYSQQPLLKDVQKDLLGQQKNKGSIYKIQKNLLRENSILRKFVRKFDNRLKTSLLTSNFNKQSIYEINPFFFFSDSQNLLKNEKQNNLKIYSKQWKHLFSKMYHYKIDIPYSTSVGQKESAFLSNKNTIGDGLSGPTDLVLERHDVGKDPMKQSVHRLFATKAFNTLQTKTLQRKQMDLLDEQTNLKEVNFSNQFDFVKKQNTRKYISKKDYQVLRYRSLLVNKDQNQNALLLLHPLKYYLQKEAAFKRKLRYYSPSIFRKFSVENNAPYFRVMMKRYFYHYKPSLRWERTMRVASLRKARRKTSRIPRKLQYSTVLSESSTAKENRSLSPLVEGAFNGQNPLNPLSSKKGGLEGEFVQVQQNGDILLKWREDLKRIQKPTYNYSVVSKRASRYRYQIYKDVLQHWYYSPFNRLLLKFDVDSFIRRQPNTHFLTAKEENLLHLRRFLLSEHYNTLRWYTNMEHYRSMKTHLGSGTKSFASRVYNQQFAGTFKKIRHLFAITPAQVSNMDGSVLKFDQPLYNEIPNNSKNALFNQILLHEELSSLENQTLSKDLLSQSQNIVRNYLMRVRSERANYMKSLLNQNNYTKLTQFIYKGQKIRGTEAVTNQRLLNNQESFYLLTPEEKTQINQQLRSFKLRQFMLENNLMEDLYITYLKKWKRHMNDQESLKHFITRRIEKREKRKQKKEKNILIKLKRLETWIETKEPNSPLLNSNSPFTNQRNTQVLSFDKKEDNQILTTGLQKAIFEGVSTLENRDFINVTLPLKRSLNTKSLWKRLLLSKMQQKLALVDSKDQNSSAGRKSDSFSSGQERFSQKRLLSQDFSVDSLDSTANQSLSRKAALTIQNLKQNQKQKVLKQIQTSTLEFKNLLKKIQHPTNRNEKQLKNQVLKMKLKNRFLNIYNRFRIKLSSFLGLNHVKKRINSIKRQTLKNWKKKERVLGKQKRLRKEFKMLTKTTLSSPLSYADEARGQNMLGLNRIDIQDIESSLILGSNKEPNRKKRDDSSIFTSYIDFFGIRVFNPISLPFINKETADFMFKRKRSPQRRSRVRRNRGVFKKRTIGDLLKKEVRFFVNFTKKTEKSSQSSLVSTKAENVKKAFYEKMNLNLYAVHKKEQSTSLQKQTSYEKTTEKDIVTDSQMLEKPLKQRKSKQRKQRFWKQKRQKYSQKRRKYRKRRRYVMGKIRVLNKQLKRIKNKIEIQNWWWKQFIPSIQTSTEALWQIEKDRLIQQKLNEISSMEMLERDRLFSLQQTQQSKRQTLSGFDPFVVSGQNVDTLNIQTLQIGNKDFKPLAIPEAIRLKEGFVTKQPFTTLNEKRLNEKNNAMNLEQEEKDSLPLKKVPLGSDSKLNVINQLYENVFNPLSTTSKKDFINSYNIEKDLRNFMFPNTALPFYAGWDESLRKFVVTNRLLSRKDAGFEMIQQNATTAIPSLKSLNFENQILETVSSSKSIQPEFETVTSKQMLQRFEFSQAPLQGMNAATTLYWQIPFTTYDPDQFFALGMDGFSPIGWRKFLFRHSILKTWLDTMVSNQKPRVSEGLIVKSKTSLMDILKQSPSKTFIKRSERTFNAKNISRRLKKRYRRVKKHPRTPVWFPSGPLLNQVLPVHYIYVFYKRSRLPRDRYLKRKLLNTKAITKSEGLKTLKTMNTSYFNMDFTLRKRLKPKRKYHLKRDFYLSNIVIPRRFKFLGFSSKDGKAEDGSLRWRPISSLKINKPIQELVKEQKYLRLKQRGKEDLNLKEGQTPNIRVKQLRRRVQRQILRTVWRYRPRAGGFVWPGDYLKLEPVKAPQLENLTLNDSNLNQFKEKENVNLNLEDVNDQRINNNMLSNISTRKNTLNTKRKKKRTLVEWQIQPKKYLYEKHNKKVLKKKLEKIYRSYTFSTYSPSFNYK